MYHDDREHGCEFNAEIPVGNAVERVVGDTVKAEQIGGDGSVDGIGRSGERAGTERHFIHALEAVLQSGDVSQEHFAVGEQMMTEGDRLRPLQMRVAGHNGVAVFLGFAGDDLDELYDQLFDGDDLFFEVELHVERHLIVAASGRVQALAVVADTLGQFSFDEGVDILGFHVDAERTALDVREDPLQALNNILNALLGDDTALAEHGRVCDAALDVLAEHAAVKRDGAVEIVGGFG